MNKYIEIIKKYRKPLLILLVVINIVALVGLTRINFSSDFQIFVPSESIYKDKLDEMNENFPSDDQLLIQFEVEETKISIDTYDSLSDFYSFLEESFEGVKINGSITDVNLESLEMFENKMLMLGELAPVKYKDGKMYHIYTLFSEEAISHQELVKIEDYLEDNNFNYAMSGNTYIQLKILDYIIFIITRIPPLALLILLFVFNLKIKSKKGTLLSVLPAGMGALWTLGLVGWVGAEVSILTVLAPIFTIVIGSADGLHFIAHVQENMETEKDKKIALIKTLKMVGVPMIITTVTSMAGFLSLLVMNTEAIKGLAIYASLGIMLAGIATWYVLPLILLGKITIHNKKQKEHIEKKGIKKLWGLPCIGIAIIVVAIFVMGAGNVKQEFNMLSIYRESTEVSQNNKLISEVNGGTLPVFIYGDLPKEMSMKEMGDTLLNLEESVRGIEGIGKVVSAFDFMEIGSNISVDSTLLEEFINSETMKFKIMVFTKNHENETLKKLDEYINEYSLDIPEYNLAVTGTSYMMMELNESMLVNQVTSSILAILIVFALLLLALRHIKSALASLVPIVMTLLFLFGFLGLTGISLNIISCTIFSITIGVGIDYAIHFTSVWRAKVKEGLSSEEAVKESYRYTARPILANAFGLSLGFTALMLSPLQIHVTVSILMWAAMISSVIFSLIVLPTLLRKIK